MKRPPQRTKIDRDLAPDGVPDPQSWDEHGWEATGPKPPRRGESFGRYVMLHEIGAGGMGVVFAAYDPELDRRVAIKVLSDPMSDARSRARLQREAQTLARVSHPNVITVHDVGSVGDRVFIAMELVDGADLRGWLDAEPRAWTEVLEVLVQAGQGLAAAHEAGLIHRDFKPANMLVGADGSVRVLDFGLARRFGAPDEAPASDDELTASNHSHDEVLTRTGAIAGTPAYMSPEQHARAELDAKSDQFSFCVTAFEALFGDRPFDGANRLALMLQVTQGQHLPLPKSTPVPARICAAIQRGLDPSADARWPGMAELLQQLRPQPKRGRRVLTGLAMGGVAVAVAWAATTHEPRACQGIESLIDQTWAEPQREALRGAFERSKLAYATESAEFVLARFDAYATEWTRSRFDACEATRVRKDQSEDLLDRRVSCLERRKRGFDATIRVLQDADDATIEHAAVMAEQLTALSPCRDLERLLADVAPPPPERREAVRSAEATLSRGQALLGAGRAKDAVPILRRALEAAEATEYGPTIGRSLARLAVGLSLSHERDQALQHFHRAGQVATELGDTWLQAFVWIMMGRVVGEGSARHEEGLRWLDYGDAALSRLPEDLSLRTELAQGRAALLSELGRLDEALAALDALVDATPEDVLPTPSEFILRGNVLTWAGRLDEATQAFERARELARQTRGADHPTNGVAYNGMGVVEFSRGNLAAAEAHFQHAYDILAAAYGDDDPELLFSIGNVGELRRMRGDYDGALETMKTVSALVARAYPPVHREVGTTNHNIASIYSDKGEPATALDYYDRAIEVRQQIHGTEHTYVANSLTGKARALLDLARASEAMPLLERALSIRAATESPPRKAAQTEFALARALQQTGADLERARALATAARDRLRAQDHDEVAVARIREINAWLVAHGGEADGPTTPPSR